MAEDRDDMPTSFEDGRRHAPAPAPETRAAPTVIAAAPRRPERIGPYKVLQALGEGGMGVVYLAEQHEPIYRRAAVKIIRAGAESRQVIARFEAERQALAMMDHANVARVYDAGVTEDGLPWFAMEHVPGVPITDYCDRHRLSMNERLELFILVCEAIQHAHQNAIIHRDIKPSNVLVAVVNGKAVPKVIDFGVAKAAKHRLSEQTVYTEQGQLIGTPEYMSPEQAEMTGLNIDTRTDIYSLGVLLYELLVGALPFDSKMLRRAGFGEIQRIIREQDPPKPSTRFRTLEEEGEREVAEQRRTDAPSLTRQLKGDLDWIIMKAMEKDRTRRYASASEFAADITRRLTDEPVIARPPTPAYRLTKFVRRHRVGASAAAFVTLALLAGFAGTAWQAYRATRAEQLAAANLTAAERARDEAVAARESEEAQRLLAEESRRRAETEAKTSGAVAGFLQDMLASADPDSSGRLVTVFETLGPAARQLDHAFPDEPEVEATMRNVIGNTYLSLGEFDVAEPLLRQAFEQRVKLFGEEHEATLDAMNDLGGLLQAQSKIPEAETVFRRTLELRKRILGDDHPHTLASMHDMAHLLRLKGSLPEAEALARQALAARERVLGERSAATLESVHGLSMILRTQGRLADAEPLLRRAVEGRRRVLGEEHTLTLRSISQFAALLKDQGKLEEAEPLLRHVLEMRLRILGEDHANTLTSMNQLALVLQAKRAYPEAEELLRRALEGYRRRLGTDHHSTLSAAGNVAALLQELGRLDEAEPLLRETLDTRRRVLGADHRSTLTSMNNLASLMRERKSYADAERLYREALEGHRRVLGESHFGTLIVTNGLGGCLMDLGRYDEAEAPLTTSYNGFRSALGARHPRTTRALADLVGLYDAWGKADKVAELQAVAARDAEEAKR